MVEFVPAALWSSLPGRALICALERCSELAAVRIYCGTEVMCVNGAIWVKVAGLQKAGENAGSLPKPFQHGL